MRICVFTGTYSSLIYVLKDGFLIENGAFYVGIM